MPLPHITSGRSSRLGWTSCCLWIPTQYMLREAEGWNRKVCSCVQTQDFCIYYFFLLLAFASGSYDSCALRRLLLRDGFSASLDKFILFISFACCSFLGYFCSVCISLFLLEIICSCPDFLYSGLFPCLPIEYIIQRCCSGFLLLFGAYRQCLFVP